MASHEEILEVDIPPKRTEKDPPKRARLRNNSSIAKEEFLINDDASPTEVRSKTLITDLRRLSVIYSAI